MEGRGSGNFLRGKKSHVKSSKLRFMPSSMPAYLQPRSAYVHTHPNSRSEVTSRLNQGERRVDEFDDGGGDDYVLIHLHPHSTTYQHLTSNSLKLVQTALLSIKMNHVSPSPTLTTYLPCIQKLTSPSLAPLSTTLLPHSTPQHGVKPSPLIKHSTSTRLVLSSIVINRVGGIILLRWRRRGGS